MGKNNTAIVETDVDQSRELAKANFTEARSLLVMGKITGKSAMATPAQRAVTAFFTTLVLHLELCIVDASPEFYTAATDGRRIMICHEWFNALTIAGRIGVIAHEALHCALQFWVRLGTREKQRFNLAHDLAINWLLIKSGFTLPSGGAIPGRGEFSRLPGEKTAEWYYDKIPENSVGPEYDPGGCGGVYPMPGGNGDGRECDQASQRALAEKWKRILGQAHAVARMRGTLPGDLDQLVENTLRPSASWIDLLREFVQTNVASDFTWSRPNRRHIGRGLYLPSIQTDDQIAEGVISVDTSGSCIGYYPRFAAELQGILEANPCKLHIVYSDAIVQKSVVWTPADGPLQLAPKGGGGTDHRPTFKWIDEQPFQPAFVIAMTDLETCFPERHPSYPVLWAVCGGSTGAPFGREIKVDLGDNR